MKIVLRCMAGLIFAGLAVGCTKPSSPSTPAPGAAAKAEQKSKIPNAGIEHGP